MTDPWRPVNVDKDGTAESSISPSSSSASPLDMAAPTKKLLAAASSSTPTHHHQSSHEGSNSIPNSPTSSSIMRSPESPLLASPGSDRSNHRHMNNHKNSGGGVSDDLPAPRPPPVHHGRKRRTSSRDRAGEDTKSFSEMSVRGLDLLRYATISPDGTYRCIECERVQITKHFKNKYSFQRHAFLYHEGAARKVFPCPICQKEFSRPDKMKSHLKTAHDCIIPKADTGNNSAAAAAAAAATAAALSPSAALLPFLGMGHAADSADGGKMDKETSGRGRKNRNSSSASASEVEAAAAVAAEASTMAAATLLAASSPYFMSSTTATAGDEEAPASPPRSNPPQRSTRRRLNETR